MEDYQDTPDEHSVLAKLLATKPGECDIVFRGSTAKGPYGLPFMSLVQKITKSPYTHAALIHYIDDELFIVEETDIGTVMWRFEDWLGFCINEKFAVYKLKFPVVRSSLKSFLQQILNQDPSYDFTFNDPRRFYCTRLVAWIYAQCGWQLCQPKTIKQIVGDNLTYKLIYCGNYLYSKLTGGAVALPMDTALYYVGNETNGGLMSSPYLEKTFENG